MGVHHIVFLYEKKLDNMMLVPTKNSTNVLPLFADFGVTIRYVMVVLVFMCLINYAYNCKTWNQYIR